MNKLSRIFSFASILAAVAGSAPVVSATGLIGERYFGATFDFEDFDESLLRNGKGATFLYNQPLTEQLDLSTRYSYLRTRERVSRDKVSGHELFLDSTYVFKTEGVKPYLRTGIGWARVILPGPDSKEWLYEAEAGIEIPVAGAQAGFTPFLNWTDGIRSRVDGGFAYGVLGHLDLGKKSSLVSRVSRDDDKNWGVSTGLLFRF